jgi:hypothetical protein
MEPLEYEIPSPVPQFPVAVLVLPIAATVLLFWIVGSNMYNEPYGVFAWTDACEQVGGSTIVILLWITWFWFVWRKRRHWPILLPFALWGMMNCWLAYELGVGYFDEIWNRP